MGRSLLAWVVIAAFSFAPSGAHSQGPRKTEKSPSTLIDGFIRSCDIKDKAWQSLSVTASAKIPYRGHVVAGIFSADADGGSVVQVFFDDLLQPDDESGLANLWYPKQQDLKEARNASGEVDYADRKFRRADRRSERVTMQLIRFVDIDHETGKAVENGKRAEYAEAPKSARWMVECAMAW